MMDVSSDLAGAPLVHRGLLAGLVLHKGDGHHQADEAQKRAHEEGGVDAQHGALGGAEARRGDVLHLGAHGDDDSGAERARHGCSVLFTEVPWFMTLLSRAFMPHVVIGMFTSDIENMRTVYTMVM